MSSNKIHHPPNGPGTILSDLGDILVVEFDSGIIAKVLRAETTVILSPMDAIASGNFSEPLPVLTKAMAAAIRSANDRWGVFSSSKVALLPHQLWVAHKVLERWPSRWLIADDVGLGKTIECGLILSPLLSRRRVRRLLVITPASLVTQWQDRLRTMFDIRSTQFVAEMDRPAADFWNTHHVIVASMQTLRLDNKDRWSRLIDAEPWDLIVVDEAHHLNASEQGGTTLALELLEQMQEARKIQGLLLFTGTPHRGKDFGFLSLLQLLDPTKFSTGRSLESQLNDLPSVMLRNNKQNVTDMNGVRLFQSVTVHDQIYEYTPEEQEFYSKMTAFILTGRAYADKMRLATQRTLMLVLITLQKLAASSVAAVASALDRRLTRLMRQDHEETKNRNAIAAKWRELQAIDNLDDARDGDRQRRLEEEIDALMESVDLNPDEIPALKELLALAKLVVVETRITRLLALIETLPPGESLLIFTEYKATQALIVSALARRFGDGTMSFINGDGFLDNVVGADGVQRRLTSQRQSVAADFNAARVRFLVSTEAAGEGIDLQENCCMLVHYDLPWNPMRLHQRVGRINRYGQKRPVSVHILRNPATIESRIYTILQQKLDRIALTFESVMADREDIRMLVLGNVAPGFFNELAERAMSLDRDDKFDAWFDQETATFGGLDAVKTVEALIGRSARFEFGSDVVPKVDLPDLKPFLHSILTLRNKRLEQMANGTASFLVPAEWKGHHWAMSDRYDGLHFGRQAGDDKKLAFGAGHIAFEAALADALQIPESVCVIAGLAGPIVVFAVHDQVTSADLAAQRVIIAMERQGVEWNVLTDWELLLHLNELAEHPLSPALRAHAALPTADAAQTAASALAFAQLWLQEQRLAFRLPAIHVYAALLPG